MVHFGPCWTQMGPIPPPIIVADGSDIGLGDG